jgi:hypothetical protein
MGEIHTEIIVLGSLELNTKWDETLNWGILHGRLLQSQKCQQE